MKTRGGDGRRRGDQDQDQPKKMLQSTNHFKKVRNVLRDDLNYSDLNISKMKGTEGKDGFKRDFEFHKQIGGDDDEDLSDESVEYIQ